MTGEEGVVILTGGASGIGKATALAVAAKSRSVALIDVNAAMLAGVAAACRRSSAHVSGLRCDVSDASSVARAYEQIHNEYGTPSVLVNCAGVGRFAPFLELAPTEWLRMLNINVMGTALFTRAVLPDMIAARSGLIINVSSRMALEGQPNTTAYAASKAAVIGMTRALAAEVAQHGIKVTLLAPGGTKTNLETPKHAGYMEPEAVADAIVYIMENRGAAWVRDLSVLPLGF